MERRNRSLQDGPELLPEAMKTRLRGVHALAVQTPVAVDSVMLSTFGTQHDGSVALGWRADYAASGCLSLPR